MAIAAENMLPPPYHIGLKPSLALPEHPCHTPGHAALLVRASRRWRRANSWSSSVSSREQRQAEGCSQRRAAPAAYPPKPSTRPPPRSIPRHPTSDGRWAATSNNARAQSIAVPCPGDPVAAPCRRRARVPLQGALVERQAPPDRLKSLLGSCPRARHRHPTRRTGLMLAATCSAVVTVNTPLVALRASTATNPPRPPPCLAVRAQTKGPPATEGPLSLSRIARIIPSRTPLSAFPGRAASTHVWRRR